MLICIASSTARKIAPPNAFCPLRLLENVLPQKTSVRSKPPSIQIAPPLPPEPLSSSGQAGSQLLASCPSAELCVKVLLTTVRSVLSAPIAPPFDALLLRNRLLTTTTSRAPKP